MCGQAIEKLLYSYIPNFVYFSAEICKCMIESNYVCFIPVCMTVVLKDRDFRFLIITCSFPAIGCTQMPRKFRLGRIRKNGERKRQKCVKLKVPTKWKDLHFTGMFHNS